MNLISICTPEERTKSRTKVTNEGTNLARYCAFRIRIGRTSTGTADLARDLASLVTVVVVVAAAVAASRDVFLGSLRIVILARRGLRSRLRFRFLKFIQVFV